MFDEPDGPPVHSAWACYVAGKKVATILSRDSRDTAESVRKTATEWFGLPESVEVERTS